MNNSVNRILLLFFCLLCSAGCQKYYLSVKREAVDRNSLASTFVGSPDPRQANPPTGQSLIMQWRLSPEAILEPLTLVLDILYSDYSQQTITYPVDRRRGVEVFSVVGNDYTDRKGLLTYKAEIRSVDGKVLKEWKQLLWTDLISVDEH